MMLVWVIDSFVGWVEGYYNILLGVSMVLVVGFVGFGLSFVVFVLGV